MTHGLRVAAQAEADLDSIAAYIRTDNPMRAQTFTEEITARFRDIAERPSSFANKEYLMPGLRSARHGRYLIFFRVERDSVLILRVLHGARDIAGLFRS